MTRRTSIEAYEKIRDEGLLGRKAFVVYDVLYHGGQMTAGEIFRGMQEGGDKIIVKGGVSARLTELRQRGVVVEVGERICNVTGHRVIVWELTDELPSPKEKVETKDQIIAALKARIAELERQLSKGQMSLCL